MHLLGEQPQEDQQDLSAKAPMQVLSQANELTRPSRRFTTRFVSLKATILKKKEIEIGPGCAIDLELA